MSVVEKIAPNTRRSHGLVNIAGFIDLYSRVNVGTKVIVLPMEHRVDTGRGARG